MHCASKLNGLNRAVVLFSITDLTNLAVKKGSKHVSLDLYVKAGARQIDMVHDARLKWIDRPRPVSGPLGNGQLHW